MRQTIALALTLTLSLVWATESSAQSASEASEETSTANIEQCVAQHESARQLRVQEQWLGARTAMLGCAEERCPLAIASDCRAWLDELARVLPTLLIVVERDGPAAQSASLRVELDGVQLSLPEPPAPLELVPGPHRLRFQLGTLPMIEQSFVLRKGEKNHLEQVRFSAPPALPTPRRPPVAERPISGTSYWLAAGALGAFAGSAVLLALGVREHRDAQAHCAPTCDPGTRTSIESKLILADVAGGAGIALAGLAVYTFLRRPVVYRAARPVPLSGPALATTGHDATLVWSGQF